MIPAMTLEETIGRRIADERNRRGMTQKRLAELAGVAAASVIRVEKGMGANFATLSALMDVLGLEMHLGRGECSHEYERVCRRCGQKAPIHLKGA